VNEDDVWAMLLGAAAALAPCADAPCQLRWFHHGWYVEVFHVATQPCACGLCGPVHRVSTDTLLRSRRQVVTEQLVSWLRHLHSPESAAAAGPLDGGARDLSAAA
jgi:hypothetical protein